MQVAETLRNILSIDCIMFIPHCIFFIKLQVYIAQLLVKYCPSLQWMASLTEKHLPRDLSGVMSQRSEIHPMKVTHSDIAQLLN